MAMADHLKGHPFTCTLGELLATRKEGTRTVFTFAVPSQSASGQLLAGVRGAYLMGVSFKAPATFTAGLIEVHLRNGADANGLMLAHTWMGPHSVDERWYGPQGKYISSGDLYLEILQGTVSVIYEIGIDSQDEWQPGMAIPTFGVGPGVATQRGS